ASDEAEIVTKNNEINRQLIASCDFFAELPDASVALLLEAGQPLRLRKGELLFREGDVLDGIYVLLSGRVQCCAEDGNGKRFVFMFNKAGDVLGEVSYLDGGGSAWGICADENSELLKFRRQDLVLVFGDADGLPSSSSRQRILLRLAGMVRSMSLVARNLALLDVYGRIRILFGEVMVESDGVLQLEKTFTQQEIAERIGSSREMVARILKELVYGHYIRLDNRRITLLKPLPEQF
ncbi:Crp/Fnr family transcriptional regulator, partial [Craterilacuibacter sp.]|uniref:Crp/Fnr family transcriptional regulator n=1 Tax=Craterilacuibacter sp. TaxID=2870909 RepID=UPI003F304B46